MTPEWLGKLTRPVRVEPAHQTWTIQFYRDENDELQPGDVLVESRLNLPQDPELGAGTRTRRITTSRIGDQTRSRSEVIETPKPIPVEAPPPPIPVEAPPSAASPVAAVQGARADATARSGDHQKPPAPPRVFATLTYQDNTGRHIHSMTEPQVIIGRGGTGYWVDLRIDAVQDISREHVRLRRDATTGRFFLKDLSLYGTSINGQRVASSIETSAAGKRDLDIEVPLPATARIGLADIVFLDFRAAEHA
jgi:hypothetical protein